ncbi:MAG TPA: ATP-dependent helicase [Gemmatimonadales bacterium]|nr:ATP-dependent helicase [Gemmatimonadales bacterium]
MVELNPSQHAAATAPSGPLLILAGAGTGKTQTLAHRVAHLIKAGANPGRILLLTFTRRAADIMIRRAKARVPWAGTFHSVANRLLRLHAQTVGLEPSFTVLDRSDSADLMNVVRNDLGYAKLPSRFPRKDTCLAIYSNTVNTRSPIEAILKHSFPAYAEWAEQLKTLFRNYVEAKQKRAILDYDDLLLYWFYLMEGDGEPVRKRFDHVLVDEYQDTNALQAEIVLALGKGHRSVTVVGDDAQAIYAFRGATIRNILDFPSRFDPPAQIIKLEQNYRSVQPILDASNGVIGLAEESFRKNLFSEKPSPHKPRLIAAQDDQAQADHIVKRVLEHREAGIPLHRQAVLMRAAHHSDLLEIELGRHNIPFVKFGGLKFLEAAHVKDVICILRWAENPRDDLAGFRVLQLLPGIGPAHARKILGNGSVPDTLRELLDALRHATQWPGQLGMVRKWYEPQLERLYEGGVVRTADLEMLEQIANGHPSRESFLSDLTLDPPEAIGDLAGDPLLDEDYLILSTIHSAKGQEWNVVYVLNVVDGCIPSDMATSSKEEIEEERRLLYVAMTRAKDHLELIQPHRFYTGASRRNGDRHIYAPRTRFIPDGLLPLFERKTENVVNVADRLKAMWS